MASFRNILFQVHLWVGLIAGIFFILLGLSGSALVYPGLFQSSAAMPKARAQGAPLPLEQVIAAARGSAPQNEGRTATVTLPQGAGDPVSVQFNAGRGGRGDGPGGRQGGRRGRGPGANTVDGDRGGAGRGAEGGRGGGQQIFVDPVSAQILGIGVNSTSPIVGIAHEMHEAMLLGGAGRTLVAWLGVGMTFLGLSGLYLWWPKSGQWKFAFGVRRTARGFRLYREIHGMMGIWFWLVFLFVTVTSIPLGFPSVLAMVTGQAARGEGPPPGFNQPQTVEAADGATPLALATLIADAEKSAGGKAVAVTVPTQANRPISVNVESADEGRPRTVAVNPYTGMLLAPAAQPSEGGLSRGDIEQLHGGKGLGPVWEFLVFLTGFLPLIFVVTGFMMWLKKRQNRNTRTTTA